MKNFGGSRKKVHSKSITFGSKIMFFERKMLKKWGENNFFLKKICLFHKNALYLQSQTLIKLKTKKNITSANISK